MKYCTCPHCDTYFKLAGASKDSLGWHTICPDCGGSFDIDIADYVVPEGTLVGLRTGMKGFVSTFTDQYAADFEEIVYLITYRVGADERTARARRTEFEIIEDWRLLKRTEFGVERVCHYLANQEQSNVPCYNCIDRTRCNADIFERLVRYEDTGLTPDMVVEYKKFEDDLVRNSFTLRHILDLIEAEREGRLVVLPAKEVYELTWDVGPGCDLSCPVSIDGQGCCNLCDHGELYAYRRECRQEHIDRIGKDVFLNKLDAELAIEEIKTKERGEDQ